MQLIFDLAEWHFLSCSKPSVAIQYDFSRIGNFHWSTGRVGLLMDKTIVFEDEHIRVIWMPGQSSTLVLSFGDLITRASGLSINAEKSLCKYQYSTLGIMPKQKTWFPQHSMQQMAKEIAPRLAEFNHIVGYGGSMGGYAAIKYSKMLGMQRAVALVPQYSIAPQDVCDTRYLEYFDAAIHQNMRINADEIAPNCEYLLIYDPYYASDREHYLKIKPLIAKLETIHLPFTEHDALAVLASSDLLHDLISHPFDATYFYRQIRRVKKQSKFYFRNIIGRLLPNHRLALLKILRNNNFKMEDRYLDHPLQQALIRHLLQLKQLSEVYLNKLGIRLAQNQQHSPVKPSLKDEFNRYLVFNLISQKLESYDLDVVLAYPQYLLPVHAVDQQAIQVELNHEHYVFAMNDRKVIKLVKMAESYSSDIHHLIAHQQDSGFSIYYKDEFLACDIEGNCVYHAKHSDKPNLFKSTLE